MPKLVSFFWGVTPAEGAGIQERAHGWEEAAHTVGRKAYTSGKSGVLSQPIEDPLVPKLGLKLDISCTCPVSTFFFFFFWLLQLTKNGLWPPNVPLFIV